MTTSRDRQLEHQFLRLLHEADPEMSETDPLAHEFASHLAMLTDDWARGSSTFPERVKWLARWIAANTQPHEVAASDGSGLELVEAGDDVGSEAGAEAGVDE
jgi:hypothetical protein